MPVARQDCTCFYVGRHEGQDAVDYATRHLHEVRKLDHRVEYVCPDYGKGWLLDYTGSGHGGPGAHQTQLRTFDLLRQDTVIAMANVDVLSGHDPEVVALAEHLRAIIRQGGAPPRG